MHRIQTEVYMDSRPVLQVTVSYRIYQEIKIQKDRCGLEQYAKPEGRNGAWKHGWVDSCWQKSSECSVKSLEAGVRTALRGAKTPGLLVEGREGGAAGPSDWADAQRRLTVRTV